MLSGVKALEEFVIKYTGDPRKGIAPTQKIKTPDEAAKISRIISDFMRQAPSVWEAALGIPELKGPIGGDEWAGRVAALCLGLWRICR